MYAKQIDISAANSSSKKIADLEDISKFKISARQFDIFKNSNDTRYYSNFKVKLRKRSKTTFKAHLRRVKRESDAIHDSKMKQIIFTALEIPFKANSYAYEVAKNICMYPKNYYDCLYRAVANKENCGEQNYRALLRCCGQHKNRDSLDDYCRKIRSCTRGIGLFSIFFVKEDFCDNEAILNITKSDFIF
jgi:hypothetical protein